MSYQRYFLLDYVKNHLKSDNVVSLVCEDQDDDIDVIPDVPIHNIWDAVHEYIKETIAYPGDSIDCVRLTGDVIEMLHQQKVLVSINIESLHPLSQIVEVKLKDDMKEFCKKLNAPSDG